MTLGVLCPDCFRANAALVEREVRNKLDADNNVITDIAQLNGWTVIELIRHKPGVVKYIAQRHSVATQGMVQIIGYAKDEVFAAVQLPK